MCAAVACRGPAAPAWPLRLVDHDGTAPPDVVVIDGLQRDVLDPRRDEHAFPLADSPPRPTLAFAIGMTAPGPAAVRFEVELRSSGTAVERVYRRDISGPAWVEDAVDLGGHELRGRELVLRKTLVAGPADGLAAGVWGNPVLLPAGTAAAPAVVLISLDTLRADRVRAYGGSDAPETPMLDAFARSGVLYEQAYAPATWTLPSHRALFFGRPPIALPTGGANERAGGPLVLAEILRRAGYLTAAFTGGGFVSRTFGFATGFDEFYQFDAPAGTGPPACEPARLDGPEVFRRAADWLGRYGRFPSFLFVHTYDAHDRCPFNEVPIREVPIRFGKGLKIKDRDRIVDHYARQVMEVDGLVGSLVDALERAGLSATTLLVVTSDHGDALWEHGFAGHGPARKPYEELARVPLIVRFPGLGTAGARVNAPVSLVNVAPTILRALGLPPSPSMRGPVLPGLGLGEVAEDVPAYVDSGEWLGVRRGSRMLIAAPRGDLPDEAYDLLADPGERRKLVQDPSAAALKQLALDYWKEATAEVAPGAGADRSRDPQIDPATRERLRALGYLD